MNPSYKWEKLKIEDSVLGTEPKARCMEDKQTRTGGREGEDIVLERLAGRMPQACIFL